MSNEAEKIRIQSGDALIVVDVQNDFLPGGSLGVPEGDEVIPVLNRCMARFSRLGLPIFATRDWHPPDHCSFKEQGGIWPPHCIARSEGAEFSPELGLPSGTGVVSKATTPEAEAYSGFDGTDLEQRLRRAGAARLIVGGLATDYCVLNTVKDALDRGFETLVLEDAIRAVNVQPDDGPKAKHEMRRHGARMITSDRLA